MSEGDELLFLAAGLLALQAWERWQASSPAQALQRGGASLYETLHPSQRGHADDLPGHQMTRAALYKLAQDTGFPDPMIAMAVALAESGGVPAARGDDGNSWGLWQIHIPSHPQFTREQLVDPVFNARAALQISKGGRDWKPWSAFRSGRYRNFL